MIFSRIFELYLLFSKRLFDLLHFLKFGNQLKSPYLFWAKILFWAEIRISGLRIIRIIRIRRITGLLYSYSFPTKKSVFISDPRIIREKSDPRQSESVFVQIDRKLSDPFSPLPSIHGKSESVKLRLVLAS